jgi:glutamate racemase
MMSKKMNIGFFDSGIGGLTVLKDAMKTLPDENYIYYADTKNVPYGIKPKDTVISLVKNAVENIASYSIKTLVVACNTATSIAINELRQTFDFPIIGMEPAVKPAVINSKDKRILVTATSLTLREEKLDRLLTEIDKNKIVDKLPLDKLVRFAEDFIFDSEDIEKYLNESFRDYYLDDYEAIVLGCTHFIFFKEIINRVIGNRDIKIVDGNDGTIRRLKTILQEKNLFSHEKGGNITFINSGEIETDPYRIEKMKEILYS